MPAMPEFSALAIATLVARAEAIAKKTTRREAEDWMITNRLPEQAQQIFKAAIGAGTSANWNLSPYGVAVGDWSASLHTRSAYFRMVQDNAFIKLPINTPVGIVTSTVSGSVVGEGHATPVSRIVLNNLPLRPIRVSATVVVTDELLRNVSAAGQALINKELASAISDGVDTAWLNLIVHTGITSTPSAGPTAQNAKQDLRTALLAVNTVGSPRLYWVASPDVAKRASTLADPGVDAFPAMSPLGGEMANLPCLVASGVPAGTLYLIDASGIATDGGQVTVKATSQGDILMDTNPSMTSSGPSAAQMTSMFQTNSVAMQATCLFGALVLRDNALAVITNIAWNY
jgi:hypothetical protein